MKTIISQKLLNVLKNKIIHNIPVLNYGRNTGTYIYLDNISHEISTETYT